MSTGQLRVLLCEDDMDIAEIEQVALSRGCYDVVIESDGNNVLNTAKETKPDIILLDLSLPGKDGFEVMQELNNDELTSGIPIIVLSAYENTEYKEAAARLGVVDYITKPFKLNDLKLKISKAIKAMEED